MLLSVVQVVDGSSSEQVGKSIFSVNNWGEGHLGNSADVKPPGVEFTCATTARLSSLSNARRQVQLSENWSVMIVYKRVIPRGNRPTSN